jgi:hypothetical protein
VSLNPIYDLVYSIKHYMIQFVSDLRQVCGFLCHKSSNWNIFESGVKHRTSNGQMMDQKCLYVVHNIKHLWVIMWHISTSTNNTTTILFPTQLWKLLYTYHVIKQCIEKETTSPSIFLLAIKLIYLHNLKVMLQYLLHLNM